MIIRLAYLLLIIVTLNNCSILETEGVIEINSDYAAQKWMYLSSDKDFVLRPYNRDKANEAEYYIIYDLIESNGYTSCIITHSNRPTNYYRKCTWLIQGAEPDLYFRLFYSIEDNNAIRRNFSYFYRVQELSKDRFRLKMLSEVVLH